MRILPLSLTLSLKGRGYFKKYPLLKIVLQLSFPSFDGSFHYFPSLEGRGLRGG